MKQRPWLMMVVIAVLSAATCVITSVVIDRPLQDTDGFLGSVWIRLPLLLLGTFAADVLPRTIRRARLDFRSYRTVAGQIIEEHWTPGRRVLVVVGVTSFYVTYISYRNLKGFLPFVMSEDGRPKLYDRALERMDRWMFFGHEPSTLLHDVLGTSFSAHLLSATYLFFLPMVPITVAIWAVWSRRLRYGYWFITAQCICWVLGVVSYYALPTLGPNFEFFALFSDLPNTGVKHLQDTIIYQRSDIRYGVTDGVQSVAGFASLHVAITMTLALVGHYTLRTKAYRVALWVYAGVTMVSTTYFGWHYIADDIAGAAIAIIAVYVAGFGTGQTFERPWLDDPEAGVPDPVPAGIRE